MVGGDLSEQARLKTAVKKWLREQLIRQVHVQRCAIAPQVSVGDPVRDTDLTVLLWSGIVIHIHLIDEPVKPARLRRIVEHATGAGIGTLFVLDAGLLPLPGQPVPADRWFMAARALTKDRLYVYYLRDGQPALRLVDFAPVSRTEVEIRYGPEAAAQHLRYFRHTVRFNAVKGYWLMADFEPDIAPGGVRFRPPPAAGNGAPPPQAEAAPPPADPLAHSYTLLGVPQEASQDEIKAAFRKRAFEVHPDVSHLPKAEAEARFKQLSAAYEYIKTRRRWM